MTHATLDPKVEAYLTTLRRIPPEVRQSMATREFAISDPWSCVCGWAIREDILAATGEDVEPTVTDEFACSRVFGGTSDEWRAIFLGICYPDNTSLIEEAFAIAVAETVDA